MIVSFWTLVSFLCLEFQRTFETFVSRGAASALPNLAIRKSVEGGIGGADSLVELTGIEPVASGLQSPRSPS
jgi:hypothetical protein